MKDDDIHKENIVFHYDRERRVQNGPEIVRKMYAGETDAPKKGLIKIFFSTRGSKIIFFTMILMILVIFSTVFISPDPASITMGSLNARIAAFAYDEHIYITITCTEKEVLIDPITLDMSIEGLNGEKKVVEQKKITEIYTGNEKMYRVIIADYDIIQVQVIITASGMTKTIICAVQK